ncbi:MAG: FG-GAP repeat domain-containing protein [Sedimentisphaeraceae bacterium JB056]
MRVFIDFAAVMFVFNSVLAAMPLETKSHYDSKLQWLTNNRYRVVMKCNELPTGIEHKIAWVQLDFKEFYQNAETSKMLFNPDSVRVVQYDSKTLRAVKYDSSLKGGEAYYVPAKIDEWPRRHLTPKTVRNPHLSWIRSENETSSTVYICYFDFADFGETEHLPKPAFIGSGDALAYGTSMPFDRVRGVPVVVDWDNDGDKDILASVGMVPERTVYLYENTGNSFEEGFAKPISIDREAQQDYEYNYVIDVRGRQIADINDDGKVDMAANGGYYSNIGEKGLGNWISIECPLDCEIGEILRSSRSYKWYFADWDGDGVKDVLVSNSYWKEYGWSNAFDSNGLWTNGPLRGWFYFFRNNGSNQEFRLAEPLQLYTADGNKAEVFGYGELVVEDFTGDGLVDIVVGDFIDNIHIFKNIGSKDKPLLAPRQRLMTTEGLFESEAQAVSVTANDYDGDGDIDLFTRGESDDTSVLENTGLFTNLGMPIFKPARYLMCKSDYPVESQLPVSSVCDWDNDGDWDLIYGNSPGFIGLYECISKYPQLKFAPPQLFNDSSGPIRIIAGYNGSIQGPAEKKWGYTVPNAGDWNGDGKMDIILNSIWGRIVWYENLTEGGCSLSDAKNVKVQWDGAAPKPEWRWWDPADKEWSTQWRSTVEMIDWDSDGLMDVAALDWEGYLVLHKRYMEDGELKLSAGERIFKDDLGQPWHINTKKPGGCGRRKFTFADWDNDGDWDFIVDDKIFGGNVVLYLNVTDNLNPQYVAQGPLCDIIVSGHTCSPAVVDLEGDGKLDLLLAAEDGHFYCFHRSYIEDRDSLRADFIGEKGIELETEKVVLFDEEIAIGQIIGAEVSEESSYSGNRSIFVKKRDGKFNVALDFRGNINIGENRKLVLYYKSDQAMEEDSIELRFVQIYTYTRTAEGAKASGVKYYPYVSDENEAADFTIDGEKQTLNEGTLKLTSDGKWHMLTLDMMSGPGMPQSSMVKPSTILRRMDFVFSSSSQFYIDNVYMTN